MMNKVLLLFLLIFTIGFYAQDNQGEYWYALDNVNSKWGEVFIPNALIEEMDAEFNRIRIYSIKGNDTLELPYLIRKNLPKFENKKVEFETINQSIKGDFRYITFKSAVKNLSRINLSIKNDEFDAFVLVEGSMNQEDWFTISEGQRIMRVDDNEIKFDHSDLEFDKVEFKYIRIRLPKELEFKNAYLSEEIKEEGIVNTIPCTWTTEEIEEDKLTRVNINLSQRALLTSFQVDIDSDNFYSRKVTLYNLKDSVKYQNGWRKRYSTIYSGYLSSLKTHKINFKPKFVKELKFEIRNFDNQPLKIKELITETANYSLVGRFDDLEAKHYLTHGSQHTRSPNYDIKVFEERIPKDLNELKIGPSQFFAFVEQKVEKEPLIKSNWWIWGIMIIIILVIGRFTIQMLK